MNSSTVADKVSPLAKISFGVGTDPQKLAAFFERLSRVKLRWYEKTLVDAVIRRMNLDTSICIYFDDPGGCVEFVIDPVMGTTMTYVSSAEMNALRAQMGIVNNRDGAQ